MIRKFKLAIIYGIVLILNLIVWVYGLQFIMIMSIHGIIYLFLSGSLMYLSMMLGLRFAVSECKAEIFVRHIRNHLSEKEMVMCKICERSIDEIYEKEASK